MDNLSDNPTACAVDFRFEPDTYLFYVNFKNNKKCRRGNDDFQTRILTVTLPAGSTKPTTP